MMIDAAAVGPDPKRSIPGCAAHCEPYITQFRKSDRFCMASCTWTNWLEAAHSETVCIQSDRSEI